MPATPTPFDPNAYLALAKSIAAGSNDEAVLRCAVGRAYYCVFLVGRSLFRVTGTSGVHTTLDYRVSTKSNPVGDMLNDLKELRQQADYELSPEPEYADWQKNWQDALALAERILTKFQQWQADPTFQTFLDSKGY